MRCKAAHLGPDEIELDCADADLALEPGLLFPRSDSFDRNIRAKPQLTQARITQRGSRGCQRLAAVQGHLSFDVILVTRRNTIANEFERQPFGMTCERILGKPQHIFGQGVDDTLPPRIVEIIVDQHLVPERYPEPQLLTVELRRQQCQPRGIREYDTVVLAAPLIIRDRRVGEAQIQHPVAHDTTGRQHHDPIAGFGREALQRITVQRKDSGHGFLRKSQSRVSLLCSHSVTQRRIV